MNNILQALSQFKNNPMALLSRYNIPTNIMNNPQAIIQHLMNTGNISQEQYNQAVQTANNMGFKI